MDENKIDDTAEHCADSHVFYTVSVTDDERISIRLGSEGNCSLLLTYAAAMKFIDVVKATAIASLPLEDTNHHS